MVDYENELVWGLGLQLEYGERLEKAIKHILKECPKGWFQDLAVLMLVRRTELELTLVVREFIKKENLF